MDCDNNTACGNCHWNRVLVCCPQARPNVSTVYTTHMEQKKKELALLTTKRLEKHSAVNFSYVLADVGVHLSGTIASIGSPKEIRS